MSFVFLYSLRSNHIPLKHLFSLCCCSASRLFFGHLHHTSVNMNCGFWDDEESQMFGSSLLNISVNICAGSDEVGLDAKLITML